MDLVPRTETFGQDDQSWLGSAHGTEMGRTITLKKSLFTSGTHYPNGYIPSGTPLGKVTATGLYGPYNDSLSNGQETLAGFLFTTVSVTASSASTANFVGALYEHGRVVEAKLPIAIDAAGKADVAGRIIFA